MSKTDFQDYLRAGYPFLWVQTDEESRAIKTLYHESGDYQCFTWDVAGGLREMSTGQVKPMPNPVTILQHVMTFPESSVLFLLDFHIYIKAPEIFRTIKNIFQAMKGTDRHIVIISSLLIIPAELGKLITVLDFPLPDVEELKEIAQKVIDDLDDEQKMKVTYEAGNMEYAKGLTAIEAENAIARSLVTSKSVDKKILEAEKLQTVKKQGLMEIYPPEPVEALRGMDNLKKYIDQRKKGFENQNMPNPKGILLVGPPGTGKSLSAKVISGVMGFPLVKTSPDNFKGGIVGESEQKTKTFWKTVKAIAPCVVWMDEIEKLFGGVQSSSKTDGGTGAAVFGMFLQEMQELKEPVYFVATCNDINELLAISQGAFIRRFDDVFFLDLPSEAEREDILGYMIAKYRRSQPVHNRADNDSVSWKMLGGMEGWSGAEIEKFVVASLYEGAERAAENIHPVYLQNRVEIDRARDWARNNARLANTPQVITEKTERQVRL